MTITLPRIRQSHLALSRAVVDISGRPFANVNLNLKKEKIGDLSV